MIILSVELQLLIIAHLSPVDILHLQQTCKALYALVEEFGDSVWKHCLRLQCLYNGVFWPTYKDLSCASELKQAATSPRRFIKAYEKRALRGRDLKFTSTTQVQIPVDIDAIAHFQLIPGGRFLAIQESSRLTIWDQQQPLASDCSLRLEPRLIFEYAMKPPFTTTFTFEWVENSTTLRFLLKTPRDRIQGVTPSTARRITPLECTLLDLEFDDRGILSILRESHLHINFGWLPATPTNDNFAFYGNKVAMTYTYDDLGSLSATVLWDVGRSEWAVWWTDCKIYDICMKEHHLFYIHRSGLQAHRLPKLSPLADDKTVYIAPYQGEDKDPSCLWSYKRPLSEILLDSERDFSVAVAPDTFNPSRLNDRPMVYEVMEERGSKMRLRRYRLFPALTMAESEEPKLKLVEWCRLRSKSYYAETTTPEIRRICDGRLATLWLDETTHPTNHFISISPPSEYKRAAFGHPSPALKSITPLVKIGSGMPDSHADDLWDNMYQFCPVSGKIMTIRNSPENDECYIRMYNFL